MKPMALDTPPEVERVLIDGYGRMRPQEKLQRVLELNETMIEVFDWDPEEMGY